MTATIRHHGYAIRPGAGGCLCGMAEPGAEILDAGGNCRSIGCDPCCPACGGMAVGYCDDPAACGGLAIPATVTADAIRAAIVAADPSARVDVEMSGGGCATVYVNGRYAPDGDWLADWYIGPGSFDYGARWASTFHRDELSIANAREDGGVYVASLVELAAIVFAAPMR